MRADDLISQLVGLDQRSERLTKELAESEEQHARLTGQLTRLLESRNGRPILGYGHVAILISGVGTVVPADAAHGVWCDRVHEAELASEHVALSIHAHRTPIVDGQVAS